MTTLLVCVALLTAAVSGVAAVTSVRIVRGRRQWHRARQIRPTLILGQAQSSQEDEEVSDVAACLQVWLDERWDERFG